MKREKGGGERNGERRKPFASTILAEFYPIVVDRI